VKSEDRTSNDDIRSDLKPLGLIKNHHSVDSCEVDIQTHRQDTRPKVLPNEWAPDARHAHNMWARYLNEISNDQWSIILIEAAERVGYQKPYMMQYRVQGKGTFDRD